MKKIIGSIITVVMLTAVSAVAHADTFNLSATIPTINGVSVTAQSVTGSTWASAGTALAFGKLTLNTFTNGKQAYLPDSYFAIDVAGTGGAGVPTLTQVSYAETTTGATKLGARANISFMALTYNAADPAKPTETAMSAHAKKALSALATTTESIGKADITGVGAGWLRIYVGLNDGTVTNLVPFSPSDAAGTYTGTLTITTTL